MSWLPSYNRNTSVHHSLKEESKLKREKFTLDKMSTCDLAFDVDYLKGFLNQGISKLNNLKGKDIVLFIGNLGAGKSSTVAYLMGAKFKRIKKDGKMVFIPEKSENHPAIGHSIKAQTVFTEIFTVMMEGSELHLCDSPGFFHNTSSTEKIAISVNLEASMKTIRSLKIGVVLKYSELNDCMRGEGLIKVSNLLAKIFTNPYTMSLSWFITDVPDRIAWEDIIEQITSKEGVLCFLKNKLQHLTIVSSTTRTPLINTFGANETEMRTIERQIKILTDMCSKPRKIFLINLEDSKSRIEILSHLKMLPPILPNQIDLKMYDSDRAIFVNYMRTQFERGLTLFKEKEKLALNIKEYLKKIENIKDQLRSLAREQTRMREIQEDIDKNLEKISRKEDQISEYENRLEEIDNEDLVELEEFSFQEKREGLFGFMSYSERTFKYQGGERFCEVEVEPEYQKRNLINVLCDKSKGLYKATYQTKYGEDADISIKLLIKRNRLQENANEIKEIKDKVKILQGAIRRLERDNDQLRSEIDYDEEYRISNEKCQLKGLLDDLNKKLSDFENETLDITKQIDSWKIIFTKFNEIIKIMQDLETIDLKLLSHFKELQMYLIKLESPAKVGSHSLCCVNNLSDRDFRSKRLFQF